MSAAIVCPILNFEQQAAMAAISHWWESDSRAPFRLGGNAGTGKTTLLSMVPRHLGLEPFNYRQLYHALYRKHAPNHQPGTFAAMTPTKRAARVLRLAGLDNARTIHSALFRAKLPPPVLEELADIEARIERAARPAGARDPAIETLIERRERLEALTPDFEFRHDIAAAFDLILVDEASMIDREKAALLTAANCRVLYCGDPFQLPPVEGDECFVEADLDAKLTELWRQGHDNPITTFANAIRQNVPIDFGSSGNVTVRSNVQWQEIDFDDFDIVMVDTNNLRQQVTLEARRRKGLSVSPQAGEPILIQKNDPQSGLANGDVVRARAVTFNANFQCFQLSGAYDPMTGSNFGNVLVAAVNFFKLYDTNYPRAKVKKAQAAGREILWADFGYAVTTHHAQGSEYERVAVISSGWMGHRTCPTTKRRWLYTAATRAKKRLDVFLPDTLAARSTAA